MDLVVECQRLPQPGETVHGQRFLQLPGGKGANQAVGAARLGARSQMIGRIGGDALGEQLRVSLDNNGVLVDAVMTTATSSSGVALIGVEQSGENTIAVVAGSNGHLSPEDVVRHRMMIEEADVLIVQLEIPVETVCAAVAIAKSGNVLTVLDPAPAPSESLPSELYSVDVMIPNQTEAEALTGLAAHDRESALLSAREFHRRGVRMPVITLGGNGAVLLNKNGENEIHVTPPQVDVIDTTAAGDAFTAAFASRLAVGVPAATALEFAAAAGAAATTVLGAQNAMPSYADVLALLKNKDKK